MFDLNDDKTFGGAPAIFNGGEAGLVKDVTISVEKKDSSDSSNSPDYKLFVDDGTGKINQGFYYFTPNPQNDEEYNNKRQNQEISRVLHVAKAVMGEDYTFPEVNSVKEAYDTLFKLVHDNAGTKKFNVYTTYGTTSRPSQYLGLRYFNFIEPAGLEKSRLTSSNNDQMERLTPDEKKDEFETTSSDSWV